MFRLSEAQFDSLDERLAQLLVARGFQLTKRERVMSYFGSHSSEYARGAERVTLLWDARDNAISLVHAPDIGKPTDSRELVPTLSLARKFSRELELFALQMQERVPHAI